MVQTAVAFGWCTTAFATVRTITLIVALCLVALGNVLKCQLCRPIAALKLKCNVMHVNSMAGDVMSECQMGPANGVGG